MQIWWDILLTQWMFSYATHKAIVIFVKHLLCEFKQMLPFSSEIWGVQCRSPLSVVSIPSTGSWRPCLSIDNHFHFPHKLGSMEEKSPVYGITWHPNLLVLVRATVLSAWLFHVLEFSYDSNKNWCSLYSRSP